MKDLQRRTQEIQLRLVSHHHIKFRMKLGRLEILRLVLPYLERSQPTWLHKIHNLIDSDLIEIVLLQSSWGSQPA